MFRKQERWPRTFFSHTIFWSHSHLPGSWRIYRRRYLIFRLFSYHYRHGRELYAWSVQPAKTIDCFSYVYPGHQYLSNLAGFTREGGGGYSSSLIIRCRTDVLTADKFHLTTSTRAINLPLG